MKQASLIVGLFAFLATATVHAAGPMPVVANPMNLVQNASFEDIDPADAAKPAHWELQGRGYYTIDSTTSHSGKSSLKWTNSDPGNLVRAQQWLDLSPSPGRKYDFSEWVKASNLVKAQGNGGGVSMQVQWWDGARKNLLGWYTALPEVRTDTGWMKIGASGITFPAEAKSIRVVCFVYWGFTGSAWFDDIDVQRVIPPVLQTSLVNMYRGWIADTGPTSVKVRCRVDEEACPCRLADAELVAKLDVPGRQPTVRGAMSPLAALDAAMPNRPTYPGQKDPPDYTDIPLLLPKLAPGDYKIIVTLRQKSNHRTVAANDLEIHRLAVWFVPKVAIDETNRLVLNGKTTCFPLGMYTGGMDDGAISRYADSPFNTLLIYGAPDNEMLDRADKHKIKVIYALNDFFVGSKSSRAPKTPDTEKSAILDRVAQFKNHPALLAWYLNDELTSFWLPQLRSHYEWVRATDPDHPAFSVLGSPWSIDDYLSTTDIIGCDPYPIPFEAASKAGDWTRITVDKSEGAMAVWMVPQAMNWAHYYTDERAGKSRAPTRAELRSMSWQAICEGATGLIYYTWEEMDKNPGLWDDLKAVGSEIKRYEPAILGQSATVVSAVNPPTWLHITQKIGPDGLAYIFAANDGSGDGSVTFNIRTGDKFNAIVGEDEGVTISSRSTPTGHTFTGTFGPLAVHVYRIGIVPDGGVRP